MPSDFAAAPLLHCSCCCNSISTTPPTKSLPCSWILMVGCLFVWWWQQQMLNPHNKHTFLLCILCDFCPICLVHRPDALIIHCRPTYWSGMPRQDFIPKNAADTPIRHPAGVRRVFSQCPKKSDSSGPSIASKLCRATDWSDP